MTRVDQIKMNAHKYSKTNINRDFVSAKQDFIAGANWVDKNPHWHKFPDEKPPKSKKFIFEKYLVIHKIFGKQEMVIARYFIHPNGYTSAWIDDNGDDLDVLFWMELPETPKFG